MNKANYQINLSEKPILVNQILLNYKRDKSHFEHYSPKFNNDFLAGFEKKVDTLVHLTPAHELENEIAKKKRRNTNYYQPLLSVFKLH